MNVLEIDIVIDELPPARDPEHQVQNKEVISYGISLLAPSIQQILHTQILIHKSYGGEVQQESLDPVNVLLREVGVRESEQNHVQADEDISML